MDVGRLCNGMVIGASRYMTVADAALLMRRHHIGDVLVQDEVDGKVVPVGIVTDRDIVVEVVAAKLDPRELKLGDLLIAPLVTAEENDSCEDAVRLMALNGVRRMPVVDNEGSLVGVITLDDLLPYFAAPLAQLSALAARSRSKEIELRP